MTKLETILLEEAREARLKAHAPYSKFLVGAAVLTKSGAIFQGCNIENSSFGATVCAEQNALFHAYIHGEHEIEAIAVMADTSSPCPPCGICRQVIMDLAGNIAVICANLRGDKRRLTTVELLPEAFTQTFLQHTALE